MADSYRPGRLWGIVAVVGVTGLALAACTDSSETPPATTGDQQASEEATDPSVPDSVAPGDALRVVEQGYSTFSDPESGEPVLSFGAVVENTGDVAYRAVVVSIHMYDSSGNELMDEEVGEPYVRSVTIGYVGPGQVMGVGDVIGFFEGQPPVDRAEVVVAEPPMEPSVEEEPPAGELTVVRAEVGGDDSCAGTEVTVASTYQTDISEWVAYVVYRDAAGSIVGGAEQDGADVVVPAGGEAGVLVVPDHLGTCVTNVIPGLADTEAYADPGLP